MKFVAQSTRSSVEMSPLSSGPSVRSSWLSVAAACAVAELVSGVPGVVCRILISVGLAIVGVTSATDPVVCAAVVIDGR